MAERLKPLILACAGPRLCEEERAFFRQARPYGFILMGRNCEDPAQLRALGEELRMATGRGDVPILIDQEGGEVATRLQPPFWPSFTEARQLGELVRKNRRGGREATLLQARLTGLMLREMGITHNCAPVLDLSDASTPDFLQPRCFGGEPELVTALGLDVCEGLMGEGITPIIKHLPGHGRASDDSHQTLPQVEADLMTLTRHELAPFKKLADMPWAMVGHLALPAVDGEMPASTSARIIRLLIRGHCGFDGVLVSDDLGMAALSGSPAERVIAVLDAGCDLALDCSGDLAGMAAMVDVTSDLTSTTRVRLDRARRLVQDRQAQVAI